MASQAVEHRGVTQRLTRVMTTLVFREIEVLPWDESLASGPVVAVANHFGGLSDGLLLIDSTRRMPHIVARDVIWRIPLVGRLASAIGMIPVHRRADGPGSSNDAMFATTYRTLGRGELLLIFPEGVTQDVPVIAHVHSGAARIALGARAHGVAGIRILPLGVHYEDKAGFRSRVLVNPGLPIDLDRWADARPDGVSEGADDRGAVEALTAAIDEGLRYAAPNFGDWETARRFQLAAEVLLNDVAAPASEAELRYGDQELLAARLNRAREPIRPQLLAASGDYSQAVRAARTSDRIVAAARREESRSYRWLRELALVIVLAPLAAIGLIAAGIPLLIVSLVSRLKVAPAVRASVVPAVAFLLFVVAWLGPFLFLTVNGMWSLGLATLLLFPFFVGALFVFTEEVVLLRRHLTSRRRPKSSELESLESSRARVADLAWEAL